MHGGNEYLEGWWVTTIKWYERDRILDNGDIAYTLNRTPTNGEVFIVQGIVRGLDQLQFKAYTGGRYILASAMHSYILQNGDLSPH